MKRDEAFYSELGNVPPLPADVYGKVQKSISRKAIVKNTVFALAASVVLVFGSLHLAQFTTRMDVQHSDVAEVIHPEIIDELQITRDYLNGDDLEQELAVYALYEGF